MMKVRGKVHRSPITTPVPLFIYPRDRDLFRPQWQVATKKTAQPSVWVQAPFWPKWGILPPVGFVSFIVPG